MKSIIEYINESKLSFNKRFEELLGKNENLMKRFCMFVDSICDKDTISSLLDNDFEDVIDDIYEMFEDASEENDSNYDIFYNIKESLRVKGEYAIHEAFAELVWLYIKEK